MKMDLRELLLVFSMLWSACAAIYCYRCGPTKDSYGAVPMCEHFDFSDKFLVACDDSTMCFKKEIVYTFGDEMTRLYERDCAKQTMNGDQERNSEGYWVKVRKIYEPVGEGCQTEGQNGKVTNTLHCYCRGNFCNGAVGAKVGILVLLSFIVILFQ